MRLESMLLEDMTGHQAGRLLLEKIYREETGKAMPPIQQAPRGKPYFASGDYHFSISHTKRRVFCVLSKQPVGVDAEELDREVNLALADKILSSSEKMQFDSATDKRLALLSFWVLKEAQGKLTGEGINGYPNHTDFSLDDPRVQIIDNCLVAVAE